MGSIRSITDAGNLLDGLIMNNGWTLNSSLKYYFGSSTDTFFGSAILPAGVTGTQINFAFAEDAHRAYQSAGLVTNLAFSQTFTQTDADMSIYGATSLQSTSGGLNGFHYRPALTVGGSVGQANYGVIDHTNSNMGPSPAALGDAAHRSRTIIHEIGHGLGLAHPHDTSGGSNTNFAGTPLDNELYTTLSYNRWYNAGGFNQDGTFFTYGHAATFMALDIAALQHMYGADMSALTGNTAYSLFDTGAAALDTDGSDGSIAIGRALYSIWDANGVDSLNYNGSNRVLLNLNDATLNTNPGTQDADLLALLSEINGSSTLTGLNSTVVARMTDASHFAGGFFSQILNGNGTVQAGGYSIANGAVVENANGGSGNDILIGNEQANTLNGNNGNDDLFGGAGNDYLIGGIGNDRMFGGSGADVMFYGVGSDLYNGGGGTDYVSYASGAVGVGQNMRIDLLDSGMNSGLALGDTFVEVEAFFLSQGNDLFSGDTTNNFIFGQNGADAIAGAGGGDIIFGEGGNDFINSGALGDLISGGTGADTFYYSINQIEQDSILDFTSGVDKIAFDDVGFNMVFQSAILGFNYVTTTSGVGYSATAAGQAQFIYYTDLGLLYADTDGAGGAAANLIAQFAGTPTLLASDFAIL